MPCYYFTVTATGEDARICFLLATSTFLQNLKAPQLKPCLSCSLPFILIGLHNTHKQYRPSPFSPRCSQWGWIPTLHWEGREDPGCACWKRPRTCLCATERRFSQFIFFWTIRAHNFVFLQADLSLTMDWILKHFIVFKYTIAHNFVDLFLNTFFFSEYFPPDSCYMNWYFGAFRSQFFSSESWTKSRDEGLLLNFALCNARVCVWVCVGLLSKILLLFFDALQWGS